MGLKKKDMRRALYRNKVVLQSINELKERHDGGVRQMFLNHISESFPFCSPCK